MLFTTLQQWISWLRVFEEHLATFGNISIDRIRYVVVASEIIMEYCSAADEGGYRSVRPRFSVHHNKHDVVHVA